MDKDFGAVAHTVVEADRRVSGVEGGLFVEYASDRSHKPQAQLYWDRWLVVCLLSLGRPGTKRDARAVHLGLRTKHAAEVVREFLNEVEPLRVKATLAMPGLDRLGVELPEDLRSRFVSAGLHG